MKHLLVYALIFWPVIIKKSGIKLAGFIASSRHEEDHEEAGGKEEGGFAD